MDVIDWKLPPPNIPTLFEPSNNTVKVSPGRSVSGSSSSSSVTLHSPSTRHLPISGSVRSPRRPVCQGRFEREFEEVNEIGSGEFGKVMKVKRRDEDGEVLAVKKSKRFEGLRHR
jgi:mitosis inhibitor protein kinase SWE1